MGCNRYRGDDGGCLLHIVVLESTIMVCIRSLVNLTGASLTLLAVFMIRCYQGMVRPLLIGSCKFYPTCSHYAIEALQAHGLRCGSVLAARRLIRCHPFSRGGFDPVPLPLRHSEPEGQAPRGNCTPR